MAGVFDIDIHDPDMGNVVDLDRDGESDDDVIEVEVSVGARHTTEAGGLTFFFVCPAAGPADGRRTLPASLVLHGVSRALSLTTDVQAVGPQH